MRRTPQPVPPLADRKQPGLSDTLRFEKSPDVCQACGAFGVELIRYREADEWDQFTPTSPIVALCTRDAKRLIDPHPRLYKPLDHNAPEPGVMRICIDCRFRDGTACVCPLRKPLGGPGIELTGQKGSRAHLNYGGGRGEFKTLWSQEPTSCTGRESKV